MKNDNRKYLSVGIDVGADFSLMAIALPSQELLGKSYRIFHNSKRSLDGAIDRIYSVMEQYDLPARIFMESTGIYHFPVYHKMREAGLDAYVLNPLVTHASKDINVRNIHNDKFDAQKIALLGLRPDLKTSIVPSDDVAAMKAILREYYAMKKETSMYICRLKDQLRQVFPQFIPVFSKVNGVAAMAVLYEYLTPDSILAAGADELDRFMKTVISKGPLHIRKKAEALVEAARDAQNFGHGNTGVFLFDPALHRDDPSFGCPDEADSDAGKSPSEGTEKLSDGKTGSLAPKHTGNWLSFCCHAGLRNRRLLCIQTA